MSRHFGLVALLAAAIYIFMYLPLATIVAASFNESRLGVQWSGFTVRWHLECLRDPQMLTALKNTLFVAGVSTAVSTLLGSALAYGLARHDFRGRNFAAKVFLVPVAIPDIVMAVSLLLFYGLVRQWTGLFQPGFTTMILAHVTFQIPFVALVVASRLRGFDRSLEEAAHDLGASRWDRLRWVTIPLLAPGILAGALLAFTLSLDDFVVSFFTSGPGSGTLPVYIYSSVKRGVTAEIHALSSLLILAAIAGTAGITWLRGKHEETRRVTAREKLSG